MPWQYSGFWGDSWFSVWGKSMLFITGITNLSGKKVKEAGKERTDPFLTLHSDAFRNGGSIPPVYTCGGKGVSPQLSWSNVPPGVKSFALIMEDPDAPGGMFSHWVVYNIPAEKRELPPSFPSTLSLPDGTRQGMNDFQKIGYGAPCPPPGTPHRYYFRIFALRTLLTPPATIDRTTLLLNIRDQVIEAAELMGFYGR
jgi:Raf kinase inhibitor-like YbhB/YbcL family protein